MKTRTTTVLLAGIAIALCACAAILRSDPMVGRATLCDPMPDGGRISCPPGMQCVNANCEAPDPPGTVTPTYLAAKMPEAGAPDAATKPGH